MAADVPSPSYAVPADELTIEEIISVISARVRYAERASTGRAATCGDTEFLLMRLAQLLRDGLLVAETVLRVEGVCDGLIAESGADNPSTRTLNDLSAWARGVYYATSKIKAQLNVDSSTVRTE